MNKYNVSAQYHVPVLLYMIFIGQSDEVDFQYCVFVFCVRSQ